MNVHASHAPIRRLRVSAAAGFFVGIFVCGYIAVAWTGPSAAPPSSNVLAPINVGGDQVKNGGLSVNSFIVFGDTLLGGAPESNAYLNFGDTAGEGGYGIRDNNGSIEVKNGTGSDSWHSVQASSTDVQTFDYTSSGAQQTWTKPVGAKSVHFECWAGGGGGGKNTTYGGGGGGGGGYSDGTFTAASLPSTVTVVVGGGGAGATVSGQAGGNGETSSAYYSSGGGTKGPFATGGMGGDGTASVSTFFYGGAGGAPMMMSFTPSRRIPAMPVVTDSIILLSGSAQTPFVARSWEGAPCWIQSYLDGADATIYVAYTAMHGVSQGGGGGCGVATTGTYFFDRGGIYDPLGSNAFKLQTGASSVHGGGGGGGGYYNATWNGGTLGYSEYAGNGGQGGYASGINGVDGSVPAGGGGGAAKSATRGGNGANGRCIITTYF